MRADAAPLLLAERDDRQRPSPSPEPLDRLERPEHAERTVEAALRHGAEVRARPHLGQPGLQAGQASHEVSVGVDLDLEASLAHPAAGEPMCLVLAGE